MNIIKTSWKSINYKEATLLDLGGIFFNVDRFAINLTLHLLFLNKHLS